MNSAMLMAKASSLLHHLAKSMNDPGEILERVNEELCESVTHGMFITIVSGFIDTEKKEILFSNAGHQPPLYHHGDGKFEEIQAMAPPLGVLPDMDFPVSNVSMQGGCMYIFTDGVTESLDENEQELQLDGLIELINTHENLAPKIRLEHIISEIRKPNISQRDDITLMVIDCDS